MQNPATSRGVSSRHPAVKLGAASTWQDSIECGVGFRWWWLYLHNIKSSNPWMWGPLPFANLFCIFRKPLYFSVCKSFVYLVKLTPKSFILLDAILNFDSLLGFFIVDVEKIT